MIETLCIILVCMVPVFVALSATVGPDMIDAILVRRAARKRTR